MNVLSAAQLYDADQATMLEDEITSLDLMERAATRAFEAITAEVNWKNRPIVIFCGIGNNGGDGLVIARKFIEQGADIHVFVVTYSNHYKADFKANLNRLEKLTNSITFLTAHSELPKLPVNSVLIDAIFGIGLSRPLHNWVKKLINHINCISALRLAIDIPSGLYTNRAVEQDTAIVKADYTITFQCPKLSFFLPQTAHYVGQLQVIDIGLSQNFIDELTPEAQLITLQQASSWLKIRPRFSHKGTYGHCLIIGGSYGKMGSVVLAAQAALRAGAGKVTTLIPRCGYAIIQTTLPEAMVLTQGEKQLSDELVDWQFTPESVVFGMGAGMAEHTAQCFHKLLEKAAKPLVVDADGLNILAQHPEWLSLLPTQSILTPHPKELRGLIGEWTDDFDKLTILKSFVQRYQIIVVAKDAITFIITPQQVFINTAGNPGMATAGTGDVLAGTIGGLLAQGYTAVEAAALGVYLHARAGDEALKKSSVEALIAGDLLLRFGQVYREMLKYKTMNAIKKQNQQLL